MLKRIVDTDNFGGDYPDERFLPIPNLTEDDAEIVIRIINKAAGENCSRYWKVVDLDYKLQPGFEGILGERDQPNPTMLDLVGILEQHLTVTDEWGGCKLASWRWGHNVMIDGIEAAANEISDRYGVTKDS